MGRSRQPTFLEDGYTTGIQRQRDLFLFAEMLWQHVFYNRRREGLPIEDASQEANQTALGFYNCPFQIPRDGVAALLDGGDSRLTHLRLAYIWPGGGSSLQLSLARDDQDRHSLIAAVDGAPVHGELGREGRLVYSCREVDTANALTPKRRQAGLARLKDPAASEYRTLRAGGFSHYTSRNPTENELNSVEFARQVAEREPITPKQARDLGLDVLAELARDREEPGSTRGAAAKELVAIGKASGGEDHSDHVWLLLSHDESALSRFICALMYALHRSPDAVRDTLGRFRRERHAIRRRMATFHGEVPPHAQTRREQCRRWVRMEAPPAASEVVSDKPSWVLEQPADSDYPGYGPVPGKFQDD